VEALQADIGKAKRTLGWEPSVGFEDMIHIMVDCDLLAAGLDCPGKGVKILKSKKFARYYHPNIDYGKD
jgi:GDPmannose 4,6-dehydratase